MCAIEFDGVNDDLDFGIAADALEALWSSGATIAYWEQHLKTGDTFTGFPLMIGRASNTLPTDWYMSPSTADNTRRFSVARATTGSLWNAGDAPSLNTWYHFALTYNGASTINQPEFYVNGDTILSTETVGSAGAVSNSTGTSIIFGADTGGQLPWNGLLEDVRIYDSVLTQSQIRVLAAGYRGPLGGEILWVSCQDAAAMTTWNGAVLSTSSLVPDMSITGRVGTPEGVTGRASNALLVPSWSFFREFQNKAATSTLTGAISAAQMVGTITKATTKSLAGTIAASQLTGAITYVLRTGIAFIVNILNPTSRKAISLDTTPAADITLDTTPSLNIHIDKKTTSG